MHIRSEERVQVKKEAKEDEEEETTAWIVFLSPLGIVVVVVVNMT